MMKDDKISIASCLLLLASITAPAAQLKGGRIRTFSSVGKCSWLPVIEIFSIILE